MKPQKIYFPIILLLSWLGFTIFFFCFGPWKYKLTHVYVFYAYLLLVHIALFFGYIRGQSRNGGGTKFKIDYFRFVEITIIISMIYLIVKLILTSGGNLSHFTSTFKNAKVAYLNSSLRYPNFFSYTDIFFFPILIIAITNTISCYNKLRKRYRYSVYLMILITMASSIGAATRGQLAQIIMLSFAALILGIYQKNIVLRHYHKVLMLFFVACVLIGFFAYSNYLIKTREAIDSAVNPITVERSNANYFLYKITPENIHPLINSTSFYISHSYYQLNKALNLPYKGLGFGLTNSFFVMRNIEKVTGWSGLEDISYGIRLDKKTGSSYGQFWSTFYTWIASDFSFPGTIIVVFFIGYLLSLTLKDSLHSLNPFSVTAFCTLFHFIFHFPFNNPLQDGSGLTTCFAIPVIWLIFRKSDLSENYLNEVRIYLQNVFKSFRMRK